MSKILKWFRMWWRNNVNAAFGLPRWVFIEAAELIKADEHIYSCTAIYAVADRFGGYSRWGRNIAVSHGVSDFLYWIPEPAYDRDSTFESKAVRIRILRALAESNVSHAETILRDYLTEIGYERRV